MLNLYMLILHKFHFQPKNVSTNFALQQRDSVNFMSVEKERDPRTINNQTKKKSNLIRSAVFVLVLRTYFESLIYCRLVLDANFQ